MGEYMSEQSNQRFVWFEAHVEKCLTAMTNGAEVVVDDDGDYVIGWEPARVYLRVQREPYWSAEVFTCAAMGLQPKVAVLREINDLNLRLASATALLTPQGSVVIKQRVHCDGVTADSITQAVCAVGGAAEDVGVLMASMFDGHSPFSIDAAAEAGDV